MERKCPTCKAQYDDGGDSWKKKCYDCYKNYKHSDRIKQLRWKENVYITHPTVTADELNKWIADKELERGWGVQELTVENYAKHFRIWFDSTNFD